MNLAFDLGYAVVPSALSFGQTTELRARLDAPQGRAGNRNVTDPVALSLAWDGPGVQLARQVLGEGARPVRILYFDKSPEANWSVPWHQDVTISAGPRFDLAGYGPWSEKAGEVHVQPPAIVLEQMVAVRFHLDPCPAENGALLVIPGSHRSGKLSHAEIDRWVAEREGVTLAVEEGDAILMAPLNLHASRPSTSPSHRRVLHIEYAAAELPEPLRWNLEPPSW